MWELIVSGKTDLKGSAVDTKVPVFPFAPNSFDPLQLYFCCTRVYPGSRAVLAQDNFEQYFTSLQALDPHKIRTFYFHFPEDTRICLFEDSLRESTSFTRQVICKPQIHNFFSIK